MEEECLLEFQVVHIQVEMGLLVLVEMEFLVLADMGFLAVELALLHTDSHL